MAAKSALRFTGLLLGLFVFGLLLWRLHAHWHELSLASAQVRAWPVAFSFLLYFLAQSAFALSWHRLLHARGETGQFAGDAARWSISLAGKYFPGKVWHGVARYGLYHGAARGDRVAPGYVREQVLMLAAAMALVALQLLPGNGRLGVSAWWFLLGAVVLPFAVSAPVMRRILVLLERWLPGRWNLPAEASASLPIAWSLQLAGQLLQGLGLFLFGIGVGLLTPALAFPAVSAFCFAGLAGIAALFVPAGLGVREAALAWFMATWIGAAPALLLAVLARLWISVGEAVVIGSGLLWLRFARDDSPGPSPRK